jgi:hypothetical protein
MSGRFRDPTAAEKEAYEALKRDIAPFQKDVESWVAFVRANELLAGRGVLGVL